MGKLPPVWQAIAKEASEDHGKQVGVWERTARAAAMALPPSDYGSTRAIHDVARLLRAAYQRGREDERNGRPSDE